MSRAEILASIGKSLFGELWHAAMARALAVHRPGGSGSLDRRLVVRWAAGARPVPDWVEGALKAVLREHRAVLQAAVAELGKWK